MRRFRIFFIAASSCNLPSTCYFMRLFLINVKLYVKEKLTNAKLYWVYDRTLSLEKDADGEKLRKLVDSGLIDVLQFRAKDITANEYEEWVLSLLSKIDRSKTIVLANDYAESVEKLNLDGVHVGQNDMPVKLVKKMLGEKYIVGVTARSLEQAKDAEVNGADYIGAGTVFNTGTKLGLVAKGPEFISEIIKETEITVFPIGGIDLSKVPELVKYNIHRTAVASCLLADTDVVALAQEIRNLL